MTDITGIIAPVVTPLDETGELAGDRIAESVDFTLECGCHAVVAAGTGVQETTTLTPSERKTLISETLAAVNGQVPVVAGVSYPAQPVVSDLIEHADAAGADALLAMPPWGLEPSQQAIYRYYESIAEETSLPILAYNNPSITVNMRRETMLDISRLDGVEYLKESMRDWTKLAWLFERVHHAGYADVFATMDVLLPTLQAVDSGVITPAPLTVPSMDIYEAYQVGDIDRAVELQRTFGTFPPDSADVGLTPVCKAATNIAGIDVGPPRPPYDSVTDQGRRDIDEWMTAVGVPRHTS